MNIYDLQIWAAYLRLIPCADFLKYKCCTPDIHIVDLFFLCVLDAFAVLVMSLFIMHCQVSGKFLLLLTNFWLYDTSMRALRKLWPSKKILWVPINFAWFLIRVKSRLVDSLYINGVTAFMKFTNTFSSSKGFVELHLELPQRSVILYCFSNKSVTYQMNFLNRTVYPLALVFVSVFLAGSGSSLLMNVFL